MKIALVSKLFAGNILIVRHMKTYNNGKFLLRLELMGQEEERVSLAPRELVFWTKTAQWKQQFWNAELLPGTLQ